MQKYNLQKKRKNPPKETKKSFKIDIRTQELISSFNTSQNIIFQKSSNNKKKIDLLVLPKGQNPLSYYTL